MVFYIMIVYTFAKERHTSAPTIVTGAIVLACISFHTLAVDDEILAMSSFFKPYLAGLLASWPVWDNFVQIPPLASGSTYQNKQKE